MQTRTFIEEVSSACSPEALLTRFQGEENIVLLRSASFESPSARYSFFAARPFLVFRSSGSQCYVWENAPGTGPAHIAPANSRPGPPKGTGTGLSLSLSSTGKRGQGERRPFPDPAGHQVQFGNPWHLLDSLMSRYEVLDHADLPFPLGGCFGYWGYDLKNFVEPKLPRRAINDLELPDCHVGFYDSLVVFDHQADKVWLVATGLAADGSRCAERAKAKLSFWRATLAEGPSAVVPAFRSHSPTVPGTVATTMVSNLSRSQFIERVERIQRYIRAGDIYQANLSHRLETHLACPAEHLYLKLQQVSPAPFSAFMDCGDLQIASSSPELFLRASASSITTRPIKGTRPRGDSSIRDVQLGYELQTSAKERAELLMITDLLRNDLGRVCEFGSVQVPELMRLEKFAQVQHLVSTVEGRLRPDVSHFSAFARCFPGGSITGAPKFRAMEIIDELEPLSRGPYTGALGYLGFNRESQLSILIRAAVCKNGCAYFHAGAGIVADSDPAAEYEETLAKAAGFNRALSLMDEQSETFARKEHARRH